MIGEGIDLAALVARLSPVLGQEKSAELLTEAARSLGLRFPLPSVAEAVTVLDHLTRVPGMVGLAARHARQRYERKTGHTPAPDALPPSDPDPTVPPQPSEARAPGKAPLTADALARKFAGAIGEAKAREAVAASLQRLGLQRDDDAPLSHDDALRVIDDLAGGTGLVAITARFAKARMLLRQ